jgi:endoglucanase
MAIEVLRRLQAESHPNIVYSGATVQEEVGLRGAQTLANAIQPDVAFALDVGIAGDTPGIKPQEAQSKLGKGPQILLYDASMIPHLGLRNLVLETAEELNIPFQYDAMAGGGTDAGRFHLQGIGVPTMVISIPTRYIHSHVSILHEDDFEHGVQLLVALIKKLDRATVEKLHRG